MKNKKALGTRPLVRSDSPFMDDVSNSKNKEALSKKLLVRGDR